MDERPPLTRKDIEFALVREAGERLALWLDDDMLVYKRLLQNAQTFQVLAEAVRVILDGVEDEVIRSGLSAEWHGINAALMAPPAANDNFLDLGGAPDDEKDGR